MTELQGMLDVDMRHSTLVPASLDTTWLALETIDMRSSPVVRTLLTLRGMRPKHPLTLGRIAGSDFRLISRREPTADEPHAHIVLGLIAKPWRVRGAIHRGPVADLNDFEEPGYAVVTWSYVLKQHDGGTLVTTRTAVRCTDDAARRRFKWYWRVVGPFSSIIRRESLRLLKRTATGHRPSGTVD